MTPRGNKTALTERLQRRREIVRLLNEGRTQAEIQKTLGISRNTFWRYLVSVRETLREQTGQAVEEYRQLHLQEVARLRNEVEAHRKAGKPLPLTSVDRLLDLLKFEAELLGTPMPKKLAVQATIAVALLHQLQPLIDSDNWTELMSESLLYEAQRLLEGKEQRQTGIVWLPAANNTLGLRAGELMPEVPRLSAPPPEQDSKALPPVIEVSEEPATEGTPTSPSVAPVYYPPVPDPTRPKPLTQEEQDYITGLMYEDEHPGGF